MENRRIFNSTDVEHYYRIMDIGYNKEEQCYFDPTTGMCYEPDGDEIDPEKSFEDGWEGRLLFYYQDGSRVLVKKAIMRLSKDRETYRRIKKPTRGKILKNRSPSGRTNFLIPDTMSVCSQTDNSNNHPKTSWAKQSECFFSIKSVVENRCMYWDGNLDGHCDCVEAYRDKIGQDVDTTRIENIRTMDRVREEKSRFEGLPFNHHFEEARKVAVAELSRLNDVGELPSITNGHGYSVFYHKKWHVIFDGNGTFLEELTILLRKSNKTARDFIREDQTYQRR